MQAPTRGLSMIDYMKDLPPGIVGLRATGMVSKADYDRVVHPLIDNAYRNGQRLRLLYYLPSEFSGFTPGAAWDDLQIGLRHLQLFERCAIVSDQHWIRSLSRVLGALLPCPVRVFSTPTLDEAAAWLAGPPQASNIQHRLLEDRRVLLIEPHGPLGVEDFDAIALTVDPWIESGRELCGIVIHAGAFPGWESLGSFLRHVRFIRDHQRRIRRIALAVDGRLARIAPGLADIFVAAEVRHFDCGELEAAIDWAAGGIPVTG